ncbi:beta-glucosidase [Asticcacaulis sp. DXS10W]|uniref:Beta-glucosidase n=1 Tax=Asticcacaulis currens TaxID=2984210 RepID=A0ABT5IBE6_9CAUL|nr:beta-glucosidase [Asticcacaulis currens]MDC7693515.1 beta-glucosidase [Asticcacaulis currens]
MSNSRISLRQTTTLALLATGVFLSGAVRAQDASVDARAQAINAQLTEEERYSLLKGYFPTFQKNIPGDPIIAAGYVPGIKRLGVPSLKMSDAGIGVANLLNRRTDDVATSLPSTLSLGASWDKDLAYLGGAMIGSEARAKGFNVLLAGSINLIRDPRNGRSFEYVSEDALLSGIIGGYGIKGVQSNRILSTVKHFAINDQETGRNVLNAKISEAALRESDLLAFQIAIEIGQPAAVMCAYNKVNGDYACENDFLLNTVLKNDWGYKGWVISDWGAVHSAGKAALNGLDHQAGYMLDKKPFFGQPLKDAVAAGEVPQARINDMTFRIIRSLLATGVMDDPAPATPQPIDYAAHAQISQKAAEAGIVLLKNERGLLPLAQTARRILVVGGHADKGVLSGGGSSQVRPVGGPALEIVPKGTAASFARITYFPSSPLEALKARLPNAEITFVDGTNITAAAQAAGKADLVIAFGTQWMTESMDVPDLNLPDNQDALIAAVAQANKNTLVVLETGGPVVMPWLNKVRAVVQAWYPGSNGGEAIARVLLGEIDAAGRLPVTFPASAEQLPRPKVPGMTELKNSKGAITYGLAAGVKAFDVDYDIEGADVGYRWFQRQRLKPLFPFGFGLSYTAFKYSDLKVTEGDGLTLSFRVTNTGMRAGIDTPQVYISVPDKSGRKLDRLVGWGRVSLAPGQSQTVTVTADPRVLANFDETQQKWRLPKGTYKVRVGFNVSDTQLVAKTSIGAQDIRP